MSKHRFIHLNKIMINWLVNWLISELFIYLFFAQMSVLIEGMQMLKDKTKKEWQRRIIWRFFKNTTEF